MIYTVYNLVKNAKDGRTSYKNTKVFAVDDEMARAVSRALCGINGYKVLDQVIIQQR